MSPVNAAAVLVLAVAVTLVLALLVRVESLLLRDLARTRDEDLRYLTRQGWLVVIVAMIPLGPLLYLRFGKGPDRYA